MKKVFLILGTLLLSLSTYAAMNVNKIDPPFWYTGMQNPELQLMVYGEGIRQLSRRLIEQHRQAGKQQLPPGLSETGQGCKTRQIQPHLH